VIAMQLRIITVLLFAVSFEAWSQAPAPPSGLANGNTAAPMNQALHDPKGEVAQADEMVLGPKGSVTGTLTASQADGTLQPSLCPSHLQGRNATAGASNITAGFDKAAFVRAEFPNGEVRIVRPRETHIWYPNGSESVCHVLSSLMQETPAGSPPDLPADPMQGRRWMENQNMRLHELISLLARDDQTVLDAIDAEEQRIAGTDLFKQITFRTGVLKSYITAGL
jgi:hypothetical protein